MNRNLFICALSVLLSGVVFSGCFESQRLSREEQRFVGTWDMVGVETNIKFNPDRGISGFFGDEYEVKDGKFVILTRFAGGYKQELYDYAFSNNDTKLVLINIKTEITHTLNKTTKE